MYSEGLTQLHLKELLQIQMSLLPAQHLEQGLEHTHPGYVHEKEKTTEGVSPSEAGTQDPGCWVSDPHFL